jgi:AAA15 family ATPase/GTPase
LGKSLKDNPKRFWSYYKVINKSRRIPNVVSHHDISASEPRFKANLFNNSTKKLLQVVHLLSSALDKKQQVDLVYLDFSKAFDRVPHDKLLHKLHAIGIHYCHGSAVIFQTDVTVLSLMVILQSGFQ